MSSNKDLLKQKMQELSKPTTKPFTGIKPMSLDDIPPQTDEQPNGQTSQLNSGATVGNTQVVEVKPPRKNIKAKLPKRQWGVQNTSRYSFEITDELKAKLNKRVAEIQLTTGKKVSASEIIRQALARELRDL